MALGLEFLLPGWVGAEEILLLLERTVGKPTSQDSGFKALKIFEAIPRMRPVCKRIQKGLKGSSESKGLCGGVFKEV